MKHLKKFNESYGPKEILEELTLTLLDAGLQVSIHSGKYSKSNHPKFDCELYIEISDNDKIFCKNYPKDDMDWLYGKPIIMNFLDELTDFGLIRGEDYKVYGGGLGVNIVFQKEGVDKINL